MSDDVGPMALYRARVAEGRLSADPAQLMAAEKLQMLANRLRGYNPAKPKRVGLGLFGWGRDRLVEKAVPGLYLYGDVGRGKSMLMDLFFDSASVRPKRRVHFHAFMQEVHAGINAARERSETDPVAPAADAVAAEATLLCFDEMEINDITDAMLVGRLFERLFAKGVVIVTTSNRHPDDLYKDGLNRHLFLPFIALIKDRLDVLELSGLRDHRARPAAQGEPAAGGDAAAEARYVTPLGPEARRQLDRAWERLAGGKGERRSLSVHGREVEIPCLHAGVARASFAELCGRPLGPADFLALAEAVHTLILDDVPHLGEAARDQARRFVLLIDALYEARVRLICSAAAEPEELYPVGTGAFAFRRTASRLQEMRRPGWGQDAAAASPSPAG